MSVDLLVAQVLAPDLDGWTKHNEEIFDGLLGAAGRYPKNAREQVGLRAPAMKSEDGIPYAAYLHSQNPPSGRYGGMSFVAFPRENSPCLIGMVIGTLGLSPDETILGRPGHARKVGAICDWLNARYGGGRQLAWAKQDPTRTDLRIPDSFKKDWTEYRPIFDKYGEVLYGIYCPDGNRAGAEAATLAFLDLLFEERGYGTLAGSKVSYQTIRAGWREHLMPSVTQSQVRSLLAARRYGILQGPPGTGKTRMAIDLLSGPYAGFGRSIQFHPNTTYESFLGGLAPVPSAGQLGLNFAPAAGFLMQSAAEALRNPAQPYLLHIDEINRADLGKILGEAIFLLEPAASDRKIELAHDFGPPFHRQFFLPPNLHILGTMNSADRSIAIVDVAVRRRFAFLSMWPQPAVVAQHGCEFMQDAFERLTDIFVEHGADDSFSLVPGHSYFLERDEARARERLLSELAPLLEEYLSQGYVSGFAESIRGYLQWLRAS